jgi:hypothetical protein
MRAFAVSRKECSMRGKSPYISLHQPGELDKINAPSKVHALG